MTHPEPLQPTPDEPAEADEAAPGASVPVPEGLRRDVEAIEAESLDKENRGWTVKYLERLRTRLAEEQAADSPDFVMISYFKREIAAYQELLERTDD